jgi:crotonobetaine/carnitine-CoA ligase
VAIVCNPGHVIDPRDLIAFLAERMTRFMVPRYVRVMDDLPRTPTQKVQKHLLRAEGVTADTFDRELAGLSLRRTRLRSVEA